MIIIRRRSEGYTVEGPTDKPHLRVPGLNDQARYIAMDAALRRELATFDPTYLTHEGHAVGLFVRAEPDECMETSRVAGGFYCAVDCQFLERPCSHLVAHWRDRIAAFYGERFDMATASPEQLRLASMYGLCTVCGAPRESWSDDGLFIQYGCSVSHSHLASDG